MTALVAAGLGLMIGYLLAALRQAAVLRALAEEKARALQDASRVPGLELKLDELSKESAGLRTRIAELNKMQETETGKTQWLEKAESHLREAFEALASRALQLNSDQFTARTREQLTEPLEKTLKALDGQVREMEKKREGAYSTLDEHLAQLKTAYDQLHSTTSDLATALTSSSGTRGQWGEIQLRRVVEMAGMVPHVNFEEQERTDAGQPDMIVHMPNGGILPVDAKTTMKSYLDAMEATDNNARKALLQAHANAVKSRIRELSSKEYWKQYEHSPDFTVMFLPNDAFLTGAFEGDRGLLEYAFAQRILLTTPVTLLALLRTVAYAWQQQDMADNAREIAAQAHELSDRFATFVGHLQKTGKSLDSAVKTYNDAIGSLQSRIMPSLRRFKELGVPGSDIPAVEPLDHQATLPPAEERE
jgi:DNA recombination protein RmuC